MHYNNENKKEYYFENFQIKQNVQCKTVDNQTNGTTDF
jgi:hypothetical protein